MQDQLRTESKDGLAHCSVGDVAVFLWRDPASEARWRWVVQRLEALGSKRAKGALCLYLIMASSTPPGSALRGRMQDDIRDLGDKLRKIIAVPVGDSIWASVVRTLVRGILLLSGNSSKQELADDIPDAIARVRRLATADTPSSEELTAAVEALYATLESEPARSQR